jgi:hypothetical protein
MGIRSEWGDTHCSIILTQHRQQWRWDDLHTHNREVVATMRHSVDHGVALIVDMRHSHWLEPEQFHGQMRIALQMYSSWGIEHLVFVVGDELTASLLNTTIARHGSPAAHYHITDTLEEAHQYIAADRHSH